MPPPSSRTGVPSGLSVAVAGLTISPPAGFELKPRSNALKARFPCRKLWILDSKLLEDDSFSVSVIKSMSLCRACTRAEAGLDF